MPCLTEAEEARRNGNLDEAYRQALQVIREKLKSASPKLPRLDLCGDLKRQADLLLDRRLELLNGELQLDTPVDWGKLSLTDSQRNWHLGYQYWLNALAHQYTETGDERYARQWQLYVEEFLDGCPYAQDARGYWPTRPVIENDLQTCNLGENGGPRSTKAPLTQRCQWMSLSCHFRIEAWLAGLSRLADSPALDDDFLIHVLESLLNDHAYVCVMNPRENTPNQFTAVTLSLLKLALVLPIHRQAASYFLIAWERLQRVFDNNLFPDGGDLEQSPNYNVFLLDLLLEVLELLKDASPSRREPIRQAAIKRLRFLVAILLPGNLQPPIAKGHSDNRTKFLSEAATVLSDDIAILALTKQEGPLRESLSFPYSGYHCIRNDKDYLLFKNSRRGSGHMHEDCLSFMLWSQGIELLTDPSHYTYNTNTEEEALLNDYALGTSAHNSLCVAGLGQRRLPLSKSGSRADDERPELRAVDLPPMQERIYQGQFFSFLEGSYADGYGENGEIVATHCRTIIEVKELGWLILDHLDGQLESTLVQQHWHLASHFAKDDVSLLNESLLQANNSYGNLMLRRLNQETPHASLRRGFMDPVQGWAFPEYGMKAEAWELIWESTYPNPNWPLLTWIETKPSATPVQSAKREGHRVTWQTSDSTELQLSFAKGSAHLVLQDGKELHWDDSQDYPYESIEGSKKQELEPLKSLV